MKKRDVAMQNLGSPNKYRHTMTMNQDEQYWALFAIRWKLPNPCFCAFWVNVAHILSTCAISIYDHVCTPFQNASHMASITLGFSLFASSMRCHIL